jgi:hypothetical protein
MSYLLNDDKDFLMAPARLENDWRTPVIIGTDNAAGCFRRQRELESGIGMGRRTGFPAISAGGHFWFWGWEEWERWETWEEWVLGNRIFFTFSIDILGRMCDFLTHADTIVERQ